MADKRQAPVDDARKASSSSDSDDEEVAQAFNSANQNNGSINNQDVYLFSCQSRTQEISESRHWLIYCVDQFANNQNVREHVENFNNRNNDNIGSVAMVLYGNDNNSSPDGDDDSSVVQDLVENGDYDSSSTEGCDADYDDDFIDDDDFLDDDDPIEDRDVDNDSTTDGHDDGGDDSTECEDTDSERSETSPNNAFSRFVERSSAFIRYIVRKAFDPTQ
jgi:hypothetical protein